MMLVVTGWQVNDCRELNICFEQTMWITALSDTACLFGIFRLMTAPTLGVGCMWVLVRVVRIRKFVVR